MKKIKCCISAAFIATSIFITSCSGTTASISPDTTGQYMAEEQMTVCEIENEPSEKNTQEIINYSVCLDQLYSSDIDVMGRYATDVFAGKTESFSYKNIDGSPWTEFKITVTRQIKGKKQPGDEILLWIYGGQISVKERLKAEPGNKRYSYLTESEKEKTILNISTGEDLPETGKEYIFFVSLTPAFSPLPSHVYEKITVGPGTNLLVSKDGLNASRINPETGTREEFLLEELPELVKQSDN